MHVVIQNNDKNQRLLKPGRKRLKTTVIRTNRANRVVCPQIYLSKYSQCRCVYSRYAVVQLIKSSRCTTRTHTHCSEQSHGVVPDAFLAASPVFFTHWMLVKPNDRGGARNRAGYRPSFTVSGPTVP